VLVAITSIHIAIKVNESFIIEFENLSELWNHEYSLQSFIKCEELLLEINGWTVYKPTAHETLNHLKALIREVADYSSTSSRKFSDDKTTLSKILESSDFNQKSSIFSQIAILDYDLSRYGAFVRGVIAALAVLKSSYKSAEYHLFFDIILNLFPNEDFLHQLNDALRLAANLFQLQFTDEADSTTDSAFECLINYDTSQCDHNGMETETSRNLRRDTSSSTIGRSSSSASIPSLAKTPPKVRDPATVSQDRLYEAQKKERMLMIKRKVISKQNLN
jgi:hypothetical protein